MFCTSLEPNTKQGQGADLSIMTALFDNGVRCKPRSETTRGMVIFFDSMLGGTIFDASQTKSDDLKISEQNPLGDECHLQSSRDPVGYSKGAPDPKHHGQVMRSAMKAEWIKSQTSEMDLLADSAPFSVWQHNKTCSRTTSIFSRPLFRVNYCPEKVTMERFIFLHRQDVTKILSTCIASLSHFMACPLQPELGTPP